MQEVLANKQMVIPREARRLLLSKLRGIPQSMSLVTQGPHTGSSFPNVSLPASSISLQADASITVDWWEYPHNTVCRLFLE